MDIKNRKAAAAAIAIALAAPAEGLRQYAYYDPPGILTVCRGHTGPDVVKNRLYSLDECDKFMTDDMRAAVDKVERCAPGLPPNVLAAFADATYNMGDKIACDTKNSTAARYLHQFSTGAVYRSDSGMPLLVAACNQLPRWDKARVAGVMVSLPGLTKRRAADKEVCLQGLT